MLKHGVDYELSLSGSCGACVLPSLGEVGPVSDHVFGDSTMSGKVAQGSGERLSKHILQVVSMVSPHPAGIERHAAGL